MLFLESFNFFTNEVELKEASIAAEVKGAIGKVSEVKDIFMKKLGLINDDASKNATSFTQRIKLVKTHTDQLRLENDIEFEIRAMQGIQKVLTDMEEEKAVVNNPNYKKLCSAVDSYIKNYEKILERVEKLDTK